MKQLISKLLPAILKSKLSKEVQDKLKDNPSSTTEKTLWVGVIVLVLAALGIEMAPETVTQILDQLKLLSDF